jgi:lysophospholipase L1-like esterase
MIFNLICLIVVLFIVVELLLRLVKYRRTGKWEIFAFKLDLKKKYLSYQSHTYIGYTKSINVTNPKFPTNSDGFAGSKDIPITRDDSSNTVRIVVCGGSTVEQNDYDMEPEFDPELTWPRAMECNLNKTDEEKNYEVMNAGCSGYTILESTIHLLTKCVPYKPDYAILYQGINDAWVVQTVPGFVPDYTHARRPPIFPSTKGFLRFFPNIRLSFVYQYTLFYLNKLFAKSPALLPYISRQNKFDMEFDQIQTAVRTYESYLRSFCFIALAHGIAPILVPWLFQRELITKLPNVNNWDKQKFIKLLEMNCDATRRVAKEIDGVFMFELPPNGKDRFRSSDWLHFSKVGLEKTGEYVAFEFLKLHNLREI